jgi:hypothetical protein
MRSTALATTSRLLSSLVIFELAFAVPSHASDDDARRLLEALGSPQCETRLQAISRYSRSEDDEQHDNAALKRLSRTAPPVTREQARAILTDKDDERKGTARLLALVEKISQMKSLDKVGRDRPISQLTYRSLLAPRADPSRRKERPPGVDDRMGQSLETMLKSPDVVLRVVDAATAALGRFPEGSDPIKSAIVRPLITGLRHASVSVRSASHVGLQQTLDGSDGVCFNATDSADRRASAIQRWEQWWDANQERLARERVKQSFW